MKHDVFQIGVNALSNSSRAPVDANDVRAILATGEGPGHLVRALFEDCSLQSLDRMAMEAGISPERLRAAYQTARARHCAVNMDFENEETSL